MRDDRRTRLAEKLTRLACHDQGTASCKAYYMLNPQFPAFAERYSNYKSYCGKTARTPLSDQERTLFELRFLSDDTLNLLEDYCTEVEQKMKREKEKEKTPCPPA